MKTIKIGEKEIKMVNSWEDLTLKQWIEFYKLNGKKEKENMIQDFYLLSIMEIFCDVLPGELDDLSLAEYQENLEEMKFLLETPPLKDISMLEMDGVKYAFPQSFDGLTTGEYISIKTLQSRHENQLDGLPYLLAVVLRPVIGEETDSETGEIIYKTEKFDTKNLQWRADTFYDKLKALDVMKAVGFFFNGKKG
jgi:hypothetical protein